MKKTKHMKKIIFITLLMVSMMARGQEFSFRMYFEDALGNRDTLTIGYDPNGSGDSILPHFGEENIAHIPFDSVFDVRISNQIEIILGNYNYELNYLRTTSKYYTHVRKKILI